MLSCDVESESSVNRQLASCRRREVSTGGGNSPYITSSAAGTLLINAMLSNLHRSLALHKYGEAPCRWYFSGDTGREWLYMELVRSRREKKATCRMSCLHLGETIGQWQAFLVLCLTLRCIALRTQTRRAFWGTCILHTVLTR